MSKKVSFTKRSIDAIERKEIIISQMLLHFENKVKTSKTWKQLRTSKMNSIEKIIDGLLYNKLDEKL